MPHDFRIEGYAPRHSGQARALLATTRRRRLADCPLLPPETAEDRELLGAEAGGAVALDAEGRLLGFLFAKREDDPVWGSSLRADVDRWAVGEGADRRILGGLYGAAFGRATGPVEGRATGPGLEAPPNSGPRPATHKIYCPSYDDLSLRAWFALGFGLEQAYAWARLADMEGDFPPPDGVIIRRAGPGDGEILAGLSPLIALAQAEAPTWAGAPEAYLADLREGFASLATDKEAMVLLALRGGVALGYQAWFPMKAATAGEPAGEGPAEGDRGGAVALSVELSVGATLPGERGRGLGRALTARGVAEALKSGYTACFTDWRTANPHSSSFWPARGFRPQLYRLTRRLDPLALAAR
ncbi:MAG TPA: hypothetical protein VMV44_06975 [Rectinemataceae bacterium]|nr:hypothetical protein [Rectinemataceae bacterium]